MNAVTYLLQQHQKYKKILKKLVKKSLSDKSRKKMFASLTKDLTHHEKMEQKIWYPYLKKNTDLSKIINHLISEEKSAAKDISKIKKIREEDKFEKKIGVFRDDVLHHAREEETKLFPKVCKKVDKSELNELGRKMRAFKRKLDEKK